MSTLYHYGLGRRKAGNARAKYYPNPDETLQLSVNGKKLEDYFGAYFSQKVYEAITKLGISTGKIEFFVRGSGLSAQADACQLALAKSYLKFDENIRPIARMHGYLTTDNRKVLSKKAGLRKARKSEQWSKR